MHPAGHSVRDQYLLSVLLEHNVLGVDGRRSGPADWWSGAQMRARVPWHACVARVARKCARAVAHRAALRGARDMAHGRGEVQATHAPLSHMAPDMGFGGSEASVFLVL